MNRIGSGRSLIIMVRTWGSCKVGPGIGPWLFCFMQKFNLIQFIHAIQRHLIHGWVGPVCPLPTHLPVELSPHTIPFRVYMLTPHPIQWSTASLFDKNTACLPSPPLYLTLVGIHALFAFNALSNYMASVPCFFFGTFFTQWCYWIYDLLFTIQILHH